ncbi:hypothetical protein NKH69_28370, partial [Mesorhizobium sp. M0976]|uniref:hypothetical protein n=1 Tax=Mesorhizobium sp. M0976 TaxID=2957038 RepID=UPI00333E0225
RQSNSSLITPDTVPDSKAIRRKRPRQRAGKIALTYDWCWSLIILSYLMTTVFMPSNFSSPTRLQVRFIGVPSGFKSLPGGRAVAIQRPKGWRRE